MAETRLSNIDTYQGVYPSVFKKIDGADITVNPFQTYKLWTIQSGSATSSCLPLKGVYSQTLPAIGSNTTYDTSKNIDDSLQTVTYFSVNHLFYKHKDQLYNTFGPTDLNRVKKVLFESASVFSFPQIRIGEGIKPGSFAMTSSYASSAGTGGTVYGAGIYGSSSYGVTVTTYISSDRYGNVYDASYNTASIIPNCMFYEGFNEYFDTTRISYESAGITYIPGISVSSHSIGLAAKFSGAGYIDAPVTGYYDRDHNYAVSFFISASNPTAANKLVVAKASSSITEQYPFRIELSGSNQIVFSAAGSSTFKAQITSSATVNQWTHILCQKSGSSLQMYVNGALHASVTSNLLVNTFSPFTASARIDNTDSLKIGGYNTSTSNLTGVVDELRIYNKALTATEVGYLADITETGSYLQTNVIGSVFAKQGLVVISTPDYRFNNILETPYTASYRSTLTTYELGVVTKVDAGDFNMSLNSTLTADDDTTYYSFVTGSDFAPYITTIGLYDDFGQLLAIGKLAQPIRKRSDVDTNFLVRIDIDKNIG
jgi:hypothetical protein